MYGVFVCRSHRLVDHLKKTKKCIIDFLARDVSFLPDKLGVLHPVQYELSFITVLGEQSVE